MSTSNPFICPLGVHYIHYSGNKIRSTARSPSIFISSNLENRTLFASLLNHSLPPTLYNTINRTTSHDPIHYPIRAQLHTTLHHATLDPSSYLCLPAAKQQWGRGTTEPILMVMVVVVVVVLTPRDFLHRAFRS